MAAEADTQAAAHRWVRTWAHAWPVLDVDTIAAERLTLAGTTVLRFRDDGLVVDQCDYWNEVDRREAPYPGW